jgi:hypothetical protein
MGIYTETPLIPMVVATNVASEARRFQSGSQPETEKALIGYLVARAELSFKNNTRFKEKMKGDLCREWLYSFMRHWCANRINVSSKTKSSALFINWANGKDLTY